MTRDYLGFRIYAQPVGYKFKPVITNWRGLETIKTSETRETREAAIALGKQLIEDYYKP